MTLPRLTHAAFLTQLFTKPGEGGFVHLVDPLRYYSRITGRVIHVPRNFPTDFASFRIGDLQLRGKTDRPAVVHDWLYASGTHRKWLCDLLFYEACRSEGMGRFRAGIRCAAVLFAPTAHRAWKAHRRGTTPGARFVRALTGGGDFTETEDRQ